MRKPSPFRFLPVLLALSLGAACTDSPDDDPPKLLSVANQTGANHRVQYGATEFGMVDAGATSDYLEVGDGELAIRVDGQQVGSNRLGSDNVGGSWTLYLQSVGGQLTIGVGLDD